VSSPFRKLRPAKIRSAVRRRWFERSVGRTTLIAVPGLEDLGTRYGGWTIPGQLIDDSWLCYCIGAGGDVSFDLALIDRYGATVRSIEPVAEYVEEARRAAAGRDRFSAYQAPIATADGPIRMQVTHDARSRSLSAASLYDTARYVEVPGRTFESLMAELGDDHIDLLKLDIEGSEYDVVPRLDLRALGVRVFATQLHHTASVRAAALTDRADGGPGLPAGGDSAGAQDHLPPRRPARAGDRGVGAGRAPTDRPEARDEAPVAPSGQQRRPRIVVARLTLAAGSPLAPEADGARRRTPGRKGRTRWDR
jgi:FkbM family methyltransferase